MRRFITVPMTLAVLVLATVACGGDSKDTGFPPPAPDSTEEECVVPTEPNEEPAEQITIVSDGVQFDRKEMLLKADTPVQIVFHNCDPQIPHNVAIYEGDDASGDTVFTDPPFGGVSIKTYAVPATKAGDYYFQCDVHPNMNGTATFA